MSVRADPFLRLRSLRSIGKSSRRDVICGIVSVAVSTHVSTANAQSALPVIGFLNGRSPDEAAAVVAAFREGLGQSGYYEGRNVLIDFRWAEGNYQRLPALARELVERNVAAIAATGGYVSALAAKQATTSIPIVFTSGGDALRLELVKTLNRPEANVTGINLFFGALGSKQIELLRLMVPRADDIAMLVNPANPTTDSDVAEVKQSARAIGVNLHIRPASTPDEIDDMLNDLAARGIDGALVGDDPFLLSRREQIVAYFTTQRIPAIYFAREFVLAGGLMSYGASLVSAYRQAGLYVGALLKGSRPSDLPVVQPTAIALTVNLRAARAIGLTVPVSVLVAADEVIE